MANLKNNMGYNHTLMGEYEPASQCYLEAADFGSRAGIPHSELALLYTNAGICYQNMEMDQLAMQTFKRALALHRNFDQPAEKARLENIISMVYYNENDLYNAGLFSKSSVESAERSDDAEQISSSYLTRSRILREGNDPVQALDYYEKYLVLRDSLELAKKIREQELAGRKYELEKSEKELRLKLKEEQVKELAIQQLTLQLEKEEQEKELLLREKDLEKSEKERLRQSLVITRQQYEVEQQERENQILEQENRINEFKLEQEAIKQREQQLEIDKLEQQQRIDMLELERQKTQKKVLTWGIVLATLILLVIIYSLISTRRKNLLLARQKKEIEEKNVDQEQKNEEISAQRDEIEAQRNLLFEQKEEIEQINAEVTESIEYARRIQTSTLPDLELLAPVSSEHLILFRPRNIVSGDFYWITEVENTTVISVADCTGHGVPGAFMSILGMSLLKEIVLKEYVTVPGVILRKLRREVIQALGQKGVSGEQRDGMDMALIAVHRDPLRLEYAGAYNSLYLVRKKNKPSPNDPGIETMEIDGSDYLLYEIKPDKMPIALYDRMDKFTTHEISIVGGDQVYLFTDGYADQFGGPEGKKFKYKPFKRLLLANAHLKMDEQAQVLGETLDNWQGEEPQVDDICLMGLKF
jgi:serine phosphatase RsbU (regulator of sigma subunit)